MPFAGCTAGNGAVSVQRRRRCQRMVRGSPCLLPRPHGFRRVTIPPEQIARVAEFCSPSDLIFAFVNKITSYILRGGLSLKLFEFEKEVKVNAQHAEFIRTRWRSFIEQFVLYAWQFGVVPVMICVAPDNSDERIPYIAPYTSWTLKYFSRSDKGPRQYAVTYNDSVRGPSAIRRHLTGFRPGIRHAGRIAGAHGPRPPPGQSEQPSMAAL